MSEAAIRVDQRLNIEERLEHVLSPQGLLYSWSARPNQALTCVVVCSSLFGDFTSNYHRERFLGRALAARGHGVIRFHYGGEGNSQGERSNMTLSSLCDDVRVIIDHAASLGFTDFALLGTRLGALVAAATVASRLSVPLALWEPVADPLRFLSEAQRAKRISQAVQGGVGPAADWRNELDRNGVLDFLGYDVYAPLIQSLKGVNLLDLLGSQPRRVFIARFRGKPGATDALADAMVLRGFSVESASYRLAESWWFDSELAPESGDLITETTSWITRAFNGNS